MNISLAGFDVYRDGGFPGPEGVLADLLDNAELAREGCDKVAELFPPASYHRPAFAFACDTEAFATAVTGDCERINGTFVTSPAVVETFLIGAKIASGTVAVTVGERTMPLFETNMHIDREAMLHASSEVDTRLLGPSDERLPVPEGGAVLWLGGDGSHDERVWLTDHLARLAAVLSPAGRFTRLDILVERASPDLDFQRRGAVAAVLGEQPYSLTFVDPALSYGVERLLFVSPASQPPCVKSPHALRHLRTTVAARTGRLPAPVPRKVYAFDSVAPGLPSPENQAALIGYLAGEGFEIIDLSLKSFKERAELFGGASLVVGPMQSALASTVLCQPDTSLIYLAAEGDLDPFFWDLAACCAHRYAVCYGVPSDTGFAIELSVLIDALALQWMAAMQS